MPVFGTAWTLDAASHQPRQHKMFVVVLLWLPSSSMLASGLLPRICITLTSLEHLVT